VSAARILVVDDDPQIRRAMRATLTPRSYVVSEAASGEEALERLRAENSELILLDINMPGMGGLEACRRIRATSDAPIIVLTINNTEKSKVDVLDAGADDYITKPFSTLELLARIRATLRRFPLPSNNVQRLVLGDAQIDFSSRQATLRGTTVRLTPKEFELLSYLIARPNRTVSHRELLHAVWGPDYGEELEYLRVFMNRLRKKIESDPAKPRFLLTDAWSGYRFQTAE